MARPSLFSNSAPLLCMLLATLFCGACSASERLAGWYVTRQIDGYLDLDSTQKKALRVRVDAQLQRLRANELPRWLFVLRETRNTLARGASDEQLKSLQQRYDGLLDDAAQQLTPDLAVVLADLNDSQISHFEQQLKEQQDESYEERHLPTEERLEETDERVFDAIESLVGELSDGQKQSISRLVRALPDERPVRYQVERKRIVTTAKLLRSHPGAAAVEAELQRLWRSRYDELGKGRDIRSRRAEQRHVLLFIDRLLTPEQRATAVANMNKLILRVREFQLPAAS